jgi:hypothetical protein
MEARDTVAHKAAGNALPLARLRTAAAILTVSGSVAVAVDATVFAVRHPQTTDFAGVVAVRRAQQSGLGCIYSRPVQLAGAHLGPGATSTPDKLPWHFNEPAVVTLLAAPLSGLPLTSAVVAWDTLLWLALAVCAATAWRGGRSTGTPMTTVAVIAGLLLNHMANTDFSLGQNDALLLPLTLAALALMRRRHDLGAGVLLGLVAVKPQLMFLALLALVIQRRWRIAAAAGITGTAVIGLSVLMVGPSCSAQWLHTATQPGELQIGIGIPSLLARWTGSTAVAEAAFASFAAGAIALLWRLRARLDTPRLVAIALALAVIIGLHTLAYDVLFIVPLGIAVARSAPWPVIAAAWMFTAAQLVDSTYFVGRSDISVAPLRATQAIPMLAVLLAVIVLTRAGPDPWPRRGPSRSVTAWS